MELSDPKRMRRPQKSGLAAFSAITARASSAKQAATVSRCITAAYNRAPMSKTKKKPGTPSSTIALNRKARHEYHVEETFEAGLVLEGWEVKYLREGKVNIAESYVLLKGGEAFLFNCRIEPLKTVSTHVTPNPVRSRKLLLHQREL